ncbi:unnamed protein product [Rotaria magnacalcarata]|uniref:UAS domain-containing protein n=1 Tax=Rotaria magnacalcarata TaxID=392030 RepID=A0A819C6T9_9BILA|nr:unnamed protein product [Rotaria magnacalcarata]CAF2266873.1 unnamed protein product [Rotaria magnacalcarata]CAF3813623.1 unnamed protein product [Rotaria magnacalcarata]CAF3858014.1 unnamed protein product [Rotaria magnacalcarata]
MVKNKQEEMLVHFQSRTTIFNPDKCINILEQFRWNCLEAINYVLENVDSVKQKPPIVVHNVIQSSLGFDQSLIPNECLNELESVRHFERAFQDRHADVNRWPIWFKASLENAINQSHGPFAIFLNHDKSAFATTFSRQILCSPSILNVFQKYKCILWPWDITYPLNKQRLIERSGRVRQVLLECLSYFHDVDNYPLLLLLSSQKDRMILLDIINGNWDLNQARACLERTLNPVHEQCIIPINETASLSPGWIGGRTAGNIRRRPAFITTFRLSRPLRTIQRPHYISFYHKNEDTKQKVVTMEEVKQWLNKKDNTICTYSVSAVESPRCHQRLPVNIHVEISSSKQIVSSSPSLSISMKNQNAIIYMSRRRAGWAPLSNR